MKFHIKFRAIFTKIQDFKPNQSMTNDQLLLIEAFDQLVSEFPDIHLVLIGPVTSTTYAAQLRETIDKLGLKYHVTINRESGQEGEESGSTDIVDAYNAADVFVLPSRHEPFGIVILEAWSAERAVVASEVGGIPTFTSDEEDVLLFESGDVDSCAAQIKRILTNDTLQIKLGKNGRQKAVQKYDWEIITRNLAQIYDEAIENN